MDKRELLILNPEPFVWQHKDKDIALPFTVSKFFFDIDGGYFQIKEGQGGSGARRFPYKTDKITLKIGNGAIEGPFPNEVALLTRLRQVKYPGYYYLIDAMGLISTDAGNILAIGSDGLLYVPNGGEGSTTYIADGENTIVTGTGTSIDPYQINVPDIGGSQDLQQTLENGDTYTIDDYTIQILAEGILVIENSTGKTATYQPYGLGIGDSEGNVFSASSMEFALQTALSIVNFKNESSNSFTINLPTKPDESIQTIAFLSDIPVGSSVDSVNGQTGDVNLTSDDIGDLGNFNKWTTQDDITKLAGIATGATANQSDAITNAAIALKENSANKQNSLTTDGSGVKFPTVDAVNAGLATKGNGTVTTVSVVTANGVTGSVSNATTTPAITLSLGAITPTTVVASGNVTAPNIDSTNKTDIAAKAPIASPTFTGTVTIPATGFVLSGATAGGYYLNADGSRSGLPFMNTVRDTQAGTDSGTNTPIVATNSINRSLWNLQKQVNFLQMLNIVQSVSTYSLPITNNQIYVTHTGTTATYILPTLANGTAIQYIIMNMGSGSITLNSNAGASDIYDGGTSVNTITILSGQTAVIYGNGNKFVIL